MSFTIKIQGDQLNRRVVITGGLDVHNATDFQHCVKQFANLAGMTAIFDLRSLVLRDAAAQHALRMVVHDSCEYGFRILPPRFADGPPVTFQAS